MNHSVYAWASESNGVNSELAGMINKLLIRTSTRLCNQRGYNEKSKIMDACIKICFRHQENYFSCFVTIVSQFETDFIHIEFLDDSLIKVICSPDISYIGERGYQKLPAYHKCSIRPVLIQIGKVIGSLLFIANNESLKNIEDDEYFRRN